MTRLPTWRISTSLALFGSLLAIGAAIATGRISWLTLVVAMLAGVLIGLLLARRGA